MLSNNALEIQPIESIFEAFVQYHAKPIVDVVNEYLQNKKDADVQLLNRLNGLSVKEKEVLFNWIELKYPATKRNSKELTPNQCVVVAIILFFRQTKDEEMLLVKELVETAYRRGNKFGISLLGIFGFKYFFGGEYKKMAIEFNDDFSLCIPPDHYREFELSKSFGKQLALLFEWLATHARFTVPYQRIYETDKMDKYETYFQQEGAKVGSGFCMLMLINKNAHELSEKLGVYYRMVFHHMDKADFVKYNFHDFQDIYLAYVPCDEDHLASCYHYLMIIRQILSLVPQYPQYIHAGLIDKTRKIQNFLEAVWRKNPEKICSIADDFDDSFENMMDIFSNETLKKGAEVLVAYGEKMLSENNIPGDIKNNILSYIMADDFDRNKIIAKQEVIRKELQIINHHYQDGLVNNLTCPILFFSKSKVAVKYVTDQDSRIWQTIQAAKANVISYQDAQKNLKFIEDEKYDNLPSKRVKLS